jgi:hypothetical protein
MPSDRILLPGDIEGLLRRGSPVAHTTGAVDNPRRLVRVEAIVAAIVEGSHASVCYEQEYVPVQEDDVDLSDLSLDLTDEAGADRAARWLAEQVGIPQHGYRGIRLAAAGVAFVRNHPIGWTLHTWNVNHYRAFVDSDRGLMGAVTVVPALASIDPADPRADLLALRAVCLHVAGRTP